MIVQVEKFMRKWNMVPEGSRVLVGVSGGADSVCLCLILYELSTKMNFSLEVIHVEHGIRGEESKNDAVFVKQLCKQRGIVCHIRNVDVPRYAKIHHLGEEEAARILRYQVFADAAGQDRNVRIALAHHMEDNAETMLFQLIRGSGLDGLCGMRPQRTGTNGEIYIRPFLQCSREQIEQFLEERGQEYCTDSTNANESYSRNRMRKRVLPELIQMNPQAVQHMQTAMEQLQQVRDYLEEETVSLEKKFISGERKNVKLDTDGLAELSQAVRMRLIRKAVWKAAGACKDITAAHLQAVADLLEKQTGRYVKLPYGLTATRVYNVIEIMGKRKETEKICLPIDTDRLPENLLAGEWKFSFKKFLYDGNTDKIPRKMYTKWFDYDKINSKLTIRNPRPGDFFVLDDKGHKKKLSRYYMDEKIAKERRDRQLVLADGSHVIWAVPNRISAACKINQNTKYVLVVTKERIRHERRNQRLD